MKEKYFYISNDELKELQISLQYQIDCILLPRHKREEKTKSLEEQQATLSSINTLTSLLKKVNKLLDGELSEHVH